MPTALAPLSHREKWLGFSAIAVSLVTMVMSLSMIFVTLSAIASEFDVSLRVVSWVVISQALVVSALMMPTGRLADMIGRRRTHLIGLVLFGAGSIFSALAPSLILLIVGRVVSAVGLAMGQAVGTAMLVSLCPASERATAIGSQMTAVAIGGAGGPVLAGLVLELASWRVLFGLLAVPIVIAFAAGYFVLDEERVSQGARDGSERFDWLGASLSAAAVGVLVFTVSNPLGFGWLSGPVLGGAVAGLSLVWIFISVERRSPSPMLDLGIFANRAFGASQLTRLLGFMANANTRFLLPIFLISFRELSEGSAGLVLFAAAVGMGVTSQFAGRLSDRFGEHIFITGGLVAMTATSLVFLAVDATTPMWIVVAIVFVNGMAQSVWSVPNTSVIMGSAPSSMLGLASATNALSRNVGNVLGQAVSAAVVVGVMTSQGFDVALDEIADSPAAGSAFMDGWRAAYLAVIAVEVAAVVAARLAARASRKETEAPASEEPGVQPEAKRS